MKNVHWKLLNHGQIELIIESFLSNEDLDCWVDWLNRNEVNVLFLNVPDIQTLSYFLEHLTVPIHFMFIKSVEGYNDTFMETLRRSTVKCFMDKFSPNLCFANELHSKDWYEISKHMLHKKLGLLTDMTQVD